MVNLHLAQRLSGHSPVAQTFIDRILRCLSLNILAGIATLAAVILATAILTARISRPQPSPVLRGLAASGALLLLLSGGLLIARAPELDQAVILSRMTPARVAPAAAAGTTFVLRAGDIVQAGKPYQSYIQVRTADGRTGWVRAEQVERVFRPVDAVGRIA